MSKKGIVVGVVALVLLALVAACGGSSENEAAEAAPATSEAAPVATEAPADTGSAAAPSETSETAVEAPAELETLKVGLYPSLDYAAFYVGLQAGIFEQHGLDVQVEEIFTGTGLFSAITSGATDLATNSLTSGTVAITNGLPIKLVSVASVQPNEGNTEVLVKADSPIQSYGDLADKKVATINLQGLFHLGVANAVESEGGDPASVKALPMSPADEPPALDAGRVDAIVIQDPFLALAKQKYDFRVLGNPFSTFDFVIPVGNFWTSIETAEAKRELLRRFKDALTESTEYANANPEKLLEVIPEYTDLTADQLGDITLPTYATELDETQVLNMLQKMLEYEWITYIPSYTQIVAESVSE